MTHPAVLAIAAVAVAAVFPVATAVSQAPQPTGAAATILPATPAFAPGATNMRDVYRVGRGVYCVAPAPPVDPTATTPLVAPAAARSRRGGSLLASYDAGGQRCPAAAAQVRTYRLTRGAPRPANDVAFEIVFRAPR